MGGEGANSGTVTGGHFDVFLSFRGPDTRDTFTDCLYEFMNQKGIRIFRDEEALGQGKNILEILEAVKCSQIYIIIFSQGYASSRWCLRELTCIMECNCQSIEKDILPIFYNVEPSDVKLETELYTSALNKHEEELGCTEVKPWKEALTKVATIKGWCLKGQRHGKVMADITEKVLQKITIRKRYLPTYLVGIDDHVEAIKKLLSCDTGGVRFVIIYGIGGIGKTTLAEKVFNQLSPQFEGHSFLSNIRESSSCCGIVKMQRKLVADLFGFSLHETIDRKEGTNTIKEILPNKRVLLVLDDMDENEQFMNLAMNSYSYGPGSRIVITTRDFPMTNVDGLEENILTRPPQILLYEMKEMHFDHALLLFNKHAFNTDLAPCDLYDLSRQVVELTGGLPLALKVIGSHLRTISKAKWKTTLTKLKEVPHEKVQQRLKISYDALGCEEQQIFLDIACFFVNKKKINAMYMWEACSFYPEVEIDVLIRKSLIRIDYDRIWMHNQLRDLGREIVRQENIKNLGDRSRLWFLEMSQAKKGTKNVVALAPRRSRHNFTREDFANLKNARFLKLYGGNFAGICEDILPELRWLCWRNCPSQLQANNFVLNQLVVLKLSGNITIEEWSGWVEIMVASKLKVLKIAGSKSLIKTPCFSEFVSLERLVLKDFLTLAEIDPSIGELQRLNYLKIKWCPHLKELPKEIGCLTALKELILIQGHNVRYLPDSIGNIRGLSRLVIEDTGLIELPETIKGLVDLKHLCLVNCTYLNSLSDALGELKSLTELDLSGTTLGNLPCLIWNLEDLTLRMNSFGIRTQLRGDFPMQGRSIRHLPDSISNVRGLPRLSMEHTGLVEFLETINGLGFLESLPLLNCTSLNSLSDAIGELRRSTELYLSGTVIGELPPSIWNLEDLTLWISSRKELQPGEKISEILQSEKSSQIYIPIFSINYASSRWWLRELKSMVESYSQSPGKQILPVYWEYSSIRRRTCWMLEE
ncbi:disease resistance protein RUN1-like [Syzygium oleosum]|uniref:disease resistance protein RUN1-like n=1 Tax=Syzygium oleosum TaxID=219896 RepID=UPI0024BBA101|nr:disease resistance protein RUN1-like [Syzygium oleosum]